MHAHALHQKTMTADRTLSARTYGREMRDLQGMHMQEWTTDSDAMMEKKMQNRRRSWWLWRLHVTQFHSVLIPGDGTQVQIRGKDSDRDTSARRALHGTGIQRELTCDQCIHCRPGRGHECWKNLRQVCAGRERGNECEAESEVRRGGQSFCPDVEETGARSAGVLPGICSTFELLHASTLNQGTRRS